VLPHSSKILPLDGITETVIFNIVLFHNNITSGIDDLVYAKETRTKIQKMVEE
jgi:hypothetical protein